MLKRMKLIIPATVIPSLLSNVALAKLDSTKGVSSVSRAETLIAELVDQQAFVLNDQTGHYELSINKSHFLDASDYAEVLRYLSNSQKQVEWVNIDEM